MHDKLGMQVIPLNVLIPHETKEFTLDLQKNMNPNDLQNQRNRGKIVVQLTFDPFKEDTSSFSKVLDEKLSGIDRGIQDVSDNGGLLLVTIEAAEDIEGKHHTNAYAVVLFRGEKKKTKVSPSYYMMISIFMSMARVIFSLAYSVSMWTDSIITI